MERQESNPYFPETQREAFRHRLAICFSAARSYDGTEQAEQYLFQCLEAFEAWQLATFSQYVHEAGTSRLSIASEQKLLAHYHPQAAAELRTVSGLLTLAVERCTEKIKNQEEALLATRIQFLNGILLPPGAGSPHANEGKGAVFTREAVLSPRVRTILAALLKQKIYLDDIIIWVGDAPEDALIRTQPYVLLEIPRLQERQVLLCDQVGEAAFVVYAPVEKGELFKMDKKKLQGRFGADVQKVEWSSEEAWTEKILHALFLEIKPGEKVNIALREDIRRELQEKFPPEKLIHPDGSRIIDFRGNAGTSPFEIRGRRFTALVRLFGISPEMAKLRTEEAGFAFLKAVFPGNAYLKPIIEKREQDQLLQKKLGTERKAWSDFIKGTPIEVEYKGGEKVLCATKFPIPDRETFRKTPWKTFKKTEYAGMSVITFHKFLFSPEALELYQRSGEYETSTLMQLLTERALFDEEDPSMTDTKVQEQFTMRELQKYLGKDTLLWGRYLKGEEILVGKRTVLTDRPLPDISAFLALKPGERVSFKAAGKGLVFLSSVFASVEPELVSESLATEDALQYHILARALYGSSVELEKRIKEIRLERHAQTELGTDTSTWRRFIQGEALHITFNGEQIDYYASETFPTVESLVTLVAKRRQKISFAGIGLQNQVLEKAFGIQRGPFGTWDPGSDQGDIERLAYGIYGNQMVGGSSLKELIEIRTQHEFVQKIVGDSIPAWRSFIQGNPLEMVIDGVKKTILVETPIRDKAEFLQVPGKKRRLLRFGGLALGGLATKIGYKTEGYVYTGEGYQGLADTLFGE